MDTYYLLIWLGIVVLLVLYLRNGRINKDWLLYCLVLLDKTNLDRLSLLGWIFFVFICRSYLRYWIVLDIENIAIVFPWSLKYIEPSLFLIVYELKLVIQNIGPLRGPYVVVLRKLTLSLQVVCWFGHYVILIMVKLIVNWHITPIINLDTVHLYLMSWTDIDSIQSNLYIWAETVINHLPRRLLNIYPFTIEIRYVICIVHTINST